MSVQLISNSVEQNTWTSHSTKEIEKLTNAGGLKNYVKALIEVIKLQGGAICDTINFSWKAVKAVSRRDITLGGQNANLAFKHFIQASLTLPAIINPHIVRSTTQWLDIQGHERPKNWKDSAKNLITNRFGFQTKFNAKSTAKIASVVVALVLGGLVAGRLLKEAGLRSDFSDLPDKPRFPSLPTLPFLIGLPLFAITAAVFIKTKKPKTEIEHFTRIWHVNELMHGFDSALATAEGDKGAVMQWKVEIREKTYPIYSINEKLGVIVNNEFLTGELITEGNSHYFQLLSRNGLKRKEKIIFKELVNADGTEEAKIDARKRARFDLVHWFYSKLQKEVDEFTYKDDLDMLEKALALYDAEKGQHLLVAEIERHQTALAAAYGESKEAWDSGDQAKRDELEKVAIPQLRGKIYQAIRILDEYNKSPERQKHVQELENFKAGHPEASNCASFKKVKAEYEKLSAELNINSSNVEIH